MKKLKLESLTAMIPILLCLALFAAAFFAASNLFFTEPQEPVYLYDVPREELEGSYVTVDLDYIYGSYAYSEAYEDGNPTGRITQREYLIDANWDDYMCVVFRGDRMHKADLLLSQSDEVYYGKREEITANFPVTGFVKPLPPDSQQMLKSALGFSEMTPQEQAPYLMLYIEPVNTEIDPVYLWLGIAMCAIMLVLLVLALSGYCQRSVKIWLNINFLDEQEKARQFLNTLIALPDVHGLRVGSEYMLVRQGYKQHIISADDLLWAYQQSTTHRCMGIIPVGKTNMLVLMLRDGKQIKIQMPILKSKEQLQQIHRQFPNTVTGYSPEIEKLYRSAPQELRHLAASQRTTKP